MSVLGLESEYKVRIWPQPSGFPLGSGHILPYIPPSFLIRIQYRVELAKSVGKNPNRYPNIPNLSFGGEACFESSTGLLVLGGGDKWVK